MNVYLIWMLCFIQSPGHETKLCKEKDDDDDGDDDVGEGAQAAKRLDLGYAKIYLTNKLKKVVALDNVLTAL